MFESETKLGKSMKRKSLSLTVLLIVFVYQMAAFCLSIAAPGMSMASPFMDCSNQRAAQSMMPCDDPSFACRPAAANQSAILPSAPSRDPSSTVERAVVTIAVISPPGAVAPSLANSSHAIPFGPSQKIPIHILNSILSL